MFCNREQLATAQCKKKTRARTFVIGALTIAGAVFGVLCATGAAVARKVVGPAPRREPLTIVAVDRNSVGATLSLHSSPETLAPGEYGIVYDQGRGHARLGEALTSDKTHHIVTRPIVKWNGEFPTAGMSARWTGMTALTPEDTGFSARDVDLAVECGTAPAWLFSPSPETNSGEGTWAIHIHGRNSSRGSVMRTIPVFDSLGITSLVVSYRNDNDASPSADGKSLLGQTEWRDVDVALKYAIGHGAKRVILVGWSMGASIALRLITMSHHSSVVVGATLIAPVVDWRDSIRTGARRLGIPNALAKFSVWMLETRPFHRLVGLKDPFSLNELNWIRAAEKLSIPLLLFHSPGDTVASFTLSRALARQRPDLVRLVQLPSAPHSLEWNRAPGICESELREWVSHLTQAGPNPSRDGATNKCSM